MMKLRTYLSWVPTGISIGVFCTLLYATILFKKGFIPHPFWLPLATYLIPLSILFSIVLFLLFIISKRPQKYAIGIAFLIVFLFTLLLTYPFLSRTTSTSSTETFRVATWNVFRCHRGEDHVRDTLKAMNADILAIQEVVDSERDGSDEWQLDRITKPLGYTATFVGYREIKRDPLAGIAICVREPVKLLSVDRRTYHPQGEWRYAFAEVGIHGQVINIVIPHLYPFALETTLNRAGRDITKKIRRTAGRIWRTTYWHRQESEELMRIVSTFEDPTIILGDFNSTPTHPIHWRLRNSLVDCLMAVGKGLTPTYTFFLPIRIDYIYVTPTIHVQNARIIATTGSDHRPIIADLSLSRSH